MIDAALVAYALAALPQCWDDRADPRKSTQLETVARAIAAASSTDDDAAKLIAVGYSESRFCLRVHSGEHRGKGRGLWQVEDRVWRGRGPLTGLDQNATDSGARVAMSILRSSYQCGRKPGDVFTAYAGRRCGQSWPSLAERVGTYWLARRRLEKGRRL